MFSTRTKKYSSSPSRRQIQFVVVQTLATLLFALSVFASPAFADTLSDIDSLIQQSRKENGEGNFSDAEGHLTQALSLAVDRTGAMSSVCGKTSRLLAEFYMNRNRLGDAEHFLLRSLVITSGYSGAISDSNGEFTNTRTFLSTVLQNPSQIPGSIEVGNTLSSLATLYSRQGRYTDAERMLKRVIQIFQSGGSNAGNLLNYSANSGTALAESQRSLAQVLYKEGNVVEAENMFKSYVNTVRQDKGDSAELADALTHLATFYKSQNRSSDADTAESEARSLSRSH